MRFYLTFLGLYKVFDSAQGVKVLTKFAAVSHVLLFVAVHDGEIYKWKLLAVVAMKKIYHA